MDLQLIAALGDFSWFSLSSWWAIARVIIGLGIVIFVHELGHFLVAKACGIKCEKFYVGFDAFDIKFGDFVLIPRRLVHWQWGETEYGIGILPLGGYVKMLGQEDSPSKMAEERQRALQGGSGEGEDGEGSSEPTVDPRSYIAQSVPKRMAVISAGVIMNLIFAVVFGTIAFYNGVFYDPPVIGLTTPGSPANQADLDGTEVVSINGVDTTDKYFTFYHLREAVIFTDPGETVELEVKRNGESEAKKVKITPTNDLLKDPLLNLPAIGIVPRTEAKVGSKLAAVPGQAADSAEPPIQTNDDIKAVNGIEVHNGYEMKREVAKRWAKPVVFTVERKDGDQTKTVDINIPANPMRTLGLVMKIEKIAMVQRDSPAAKATSGSMTGMEIGDEILLIDGEPVGDPFTIEQRMVELLDAGKTNVVIKVKRTDEDKNVNEFEFDVPIRYPRNLPFFRNGPMVVDSLGIAFRVSNKVVGIVPGSPAEGSKIKVGDSITAVQYKPSDKDLEKVSEYYSKELYEKTELNSDETKYAWPVVHEILQTLYAGTNIELQVKSGDKKSNVTLKVEKSEKWCVPSRGIPLTGERRLYQAKSLGEAVALGYKQTWEDASRVLKFLNRLITGKISPTSLGGPATIAVVATSEASEGTSRLLMFLVLISANLAIVNFLPIPVLDGGHMVFLTWELVTGKPPSETVQGLLSWVGLAFLLTLMLFVLGLDFFRIFFT